MQKKGITRVSFLACTVLLFTTVIAKADTVYTTFGPGQTHQSSGYLIGTYQSTNQVVAMPFVPTETVTLTDAVLALYSATGTTVNVYVESSAGGAPGAILDTLTQVGSIPTTAGIVDFTCATCSILSSGVLYFLVAQDTSSTSSAGWAFSPTLTGAIDYDTNGSATGPWTSDTGDFTAFAVDGVTGVNSVPEVPSILLLASGLAGILVLWRLRVWAEVHG